MSLIPAPIVLTDAGNMKECMDNMYLKTQSILNDTTITNLSLNEGMQLSNSSTSSTFTQSSSGDLTISNSTSITCQTPFINQTDGISPNFISMDLQTSSTQNPLITLTKNSSILGTITETDNGMEIQTIQEMNVIAEKRMIIQSQNDNTSLFNPIGSVYIDRTGIITGDGDIYASNFYGNASSSSTSNTASYATNIQVNNTSANLNHYLTFANSNTTGYKLLQATNGLIFNPNSNTLTTTTFAGALSGNATTCSIATNINTTLDNTTSSNCPIHFGTTTSGSQSTKVNIAGLYYRPNVNILNCNFEGALTGTSTNSNAINLTSDDTAGTYYIPFSKLSAGSARQLYIDDITTPLSYNPSTGTLTATNFSGLATNTTNVLFTSDNTNANYYLPFVKTTGTGQKPMFIDDTTLPLQYNPSSSVLTVGGLIGTIQLPTDNVTATFTSGTTLTINMGGFRSFNTCRIGFTGTTNTISLFAFSSAVVNGKFGVAIYNGGTGNLTINNTGFGAGYKTSYPANVVVPTLQSAYMEINYINFTTGGNIFVVSCFLLN